MIGLPSIVSLSLNRSMATLTYASSHGPATTVSWKKNGIVLDKGSVDFNQNQRLVDAETATYESYLITSNLSILVGEFTCVISNSRGATEKTLLLEGSYMLHPWHAIINFDPTDPSYSGVYIISSPLIVGQTATVTCISYVEGQEMKWLNGDNVLSTVSSQQSINLTIFVEDSLHNETYTCRVTTINNMIVEETITMTVIGELIVPNNNILIACN